MKWSEIENSPKFQAFTPDKKAAARARFFADYVAPNAPENLDKRELYGKWMAPFTPSGRRQNERHGLNPDGAPLKPGAGHGERGTKSYYQTKAAEPADDYVPAPLRAFTEAATEAQNYTDTAVGAAIEGVE